MVNKSSKNFFFIFSRYFLILLAGLGNLYIFYKVFTPLTISLVSLFLRTHSGSVFLLANASVELIPACIAGAAYYLLFILVFSAPNIAVKKRLAVLLFSFAVFLLLNVFRIVLLALLIGSSAFNFVHLVFWYVLSTIFVVGIWLADVKIFKINTIPVISDLKFTIKQIK